MTKKITIEYFGMSGEGPTVKEAKLDAGKKIQGLLTDLMRGPYIHTQGAVTGLLWLGRWGWESRLLSNDEGARLKSGPVTSCTTGYRDFSDARRSLIQHVAQVSWDHDCNDEAHADEAVRDLPSRDSETKQLRSDLLRYFAWQRRFKAAVDAGHSTTEAHEIASGLRV